MDPLIWFYRDGSQASGVTVVGRDSGKALRWRKCGRCGGAGGADKWAATGWTCYQCGGNCGRMVTVPIYKAEKLAALNAAQAKAQAKRLAKHLAKVAAEKAAAKATRRALFTAHEEYARRAWRVRSDRFIREMLRLALGRKPLTGGQLDALYTAVEKAEAWKLERERKAAERAAQKHVGRVGERIEVAAVIEKRITGGDVYSAFGPWCLSILRTDGGDVLTTFGRLRADEGCRVTIRATVKAHERNRKTDAAETQVFRVKVLSVEQPAGA